MILLLKEEEENRFWEATGSLCHLMSLSSFYICGNRRGESEQCLPRSYGQPTAEHTFSSGPSDPQTGFASHPANKFNHQGAHCLLRDKRYLHVIRYVKASPVHAEMRPQNTHCQTIAVRVMQLGKTEKEPTGPVGKPCLRWRDNRVLQEKVMV